ncbi:MAG: glycerate kinase [Burkholderiaceae bacterium]|nr:glycerate kinase [Burkholderiaceae bacterium]
MKIQKIFVAVAGVALVAAAWRAFGWAGVAFVATGIVMWALMTFTRMMKVLQRARDRPMGHVDSAVMLNAKLKTRMSLLHVLAMTRSLGEFRSEEGAQPEIFRWTDTSDSHVTTEFVDGKLTKWELQRPTQPDEAEPAALPTPPAP